MSHSREDYDSKCTADEWRNVDERKSWRCNTIKENFPEVLEMCKICHKNIPNEDNIDIEKMKTAIDILTSGDPLGFILNIRNKFHSLDRLSGYILLCCPVCKSIVVSDLLSIKNQEDELNSKIKKEEVNSKDEI